MTIKLFSLFLVAAAILTVPAVYPVPNPVGNGTGLVQVQINGMEYIKLLNYSTVIVNTVRLACGANAEYNTLLALNFSNSASTPINATVLFNASYSATAVLIISTPLTFEVPANTSGYVITQNVPTEVGIQNAPVLPNLSFAVSLAQASNATLSFKCPKTIPLIRLVMQPKGVGAVAEGG